MLYSKTDFIMIVDKPHAILGGDDWFIWIQRKLWQLLPDGLADQQDPRYTNCSGTVLRATDIRAGAIKKSVITHWKLLKANLKNTHDVKASGNLWYALGIHAVRTIVNIKTKVNSELTMSIGLSICQHIANGLLCVLGQNKKHVDGLVVKLLLRSKRSGVRSPASPLEFQRLVISCFQVAIWLKYRLSDVILNTTNQPTKDILKIHTIVVYDPGVVVAGVCVPFLL